MTKVKTKHKTWVANCKLVFQENYIRILQSKTTLIDKKQQNRSSQINECQSKLWKIGIDKKVILNNYTVLKMKDKLLVLIWILAQ